MRNTVNVIGGKPIAIRSQSISNVKAINPLVTFYDTMEERERCYSFILYRIPHKIKNNNRKYDHISDFRAKLK
jgi:hypothetical protein